MGTPSPTCQVKDGSGSYGATTTGVDVTPGNTVTIKLASTADVTTWSISCFGTDELGSAPTLTIDSVNKTATFTAPVAGRALLFKSIVNNGTDVNGTAVSSYTTTFGVYTRNLGRRVCAVNETMEADATFGYASTINPILRLGTTLQPSRGILSTSAASILLVSGTHDIVVLTTANAYAQLPASPVNGESYTIKSANTGQYIDGNGKTIDGSATLLFAAPYASIDVVYDLTNTQWRAV